MWIVLDWNLRCSDGGNTMAFYKSIIFLDLWVDILSKGALSILPHPLICLFSYIMMISCRANLLSYIILYFDSQIVRGFIHWSFQVRSFFFFNLFFFFLFNLFFLMDYLKIFFKAVRFRAKLSGKYRDFQYTSGPQNTQHPPLSKDNTGVVHLLQWMNVH